MKNEGIANHNYNVGKILKAKNLCEVFKLLILICERKNGGTENEG